MAESCSRLDVRTIARVASDVLRFVSSLLRPHVQLAAENLFLRKQLALYLERQVKPRRADDATRIALVALSRLIDWRRVLTVVKPGSNRGPGSQAWSSFVRNQARAVLACDFFVAVTATFRLLYIFVVLEVGTRRILHWNVTDHPTAEWTTQQFRMVVSGDQPHRFVVHDRDSIYSEGVDQTIAAMGLTVLKTPVRAPQANAFCERLIGTIRRECLDFIIPLNERHVRRLLREWVAHYNRGRPHTSLGPGFPSRRPIASHHSRTAIRFVMVIASSRSQFSADCTTSIVSSRWPHEPTRARCEFLR
jgi:transposase InsO family protein